MFTLFKQQVRNEVYFVKKIENPLAKFTFFFI